MKRIWLAMLATLSLTAVAAVGMPERTDDVAVAASVRLQVDLSERRLYVIEGGEVATSYPVAIGKPSYPPAMLQEAARKYLRNDRYVRVSLYPEQ